MLANLSGVRDKAGMPSRRAVHIHTCLVAPVQVEEGCTLFERWLWVGKQCCVASSNQSVSARDRYVCNGMNKLQGEGLVGMVALGRSLRSMGSAGLQRGDVGSGELVPSPSRWLSLTRNQVDVVLTSP